MKKAILTLGLFSMMLVLTSFTTPSNFNFATTSENNIAQHGMLLPSYDQKEDLEPGISPTVWTPKKDIDIYLDGTSMEELNDNEPGGGVPSMPRKVD